MLHQQKNLKLRRFAWRFPITPRHPVVELQHLRGPLSRWKMGRIGFHRRFKKGTFIWAERNERLHVVSIYIYTQIYTPEEHKSYHRMNRIGKAAIFSSNGKFVGPALFWMAILNGLKNKQQEGMSKKLGDSRFKRLHKTWLQGLKL